MKPRPIRILQILLLFGLLPFGTDTIVGPALRAQDAPAQATTSSVDVEALERFARAFVEIERVRDELQREFARRHAVRQREEARAEADTRIDEILERYGLTLDEFGDLNRIIGTDPAQREAFEDLLAEIRGGGGTPEEPHDG